MTKKNAKNSRVHNLFSRIADASRKVILAATQPTEAVPTASLPTTDARIPVHKISAEGMKIIENLISMIGNIIAKQGRVELRDEEFHVMGHQGWCTVTPIVPTTVHYITIRWWEAGECRTVRVRYENPANWEIFYAS